MKRLITGVVVALLAGGDSTSAARQAPTIDEESDPSDFDHEVTRYGIMLEKSLELGQSAPVPLAAPRERAQILMAGLQATVRQYNYVRFENCSSGYLPKLSCGAAWMPAWLEEPAAAVRSLDIVRARATKVADRVEPYWDAACAEAEKRLEHDNWMEYCSME